MARKAGPFDLSVFYEVENRRLQRAFNPQTGFVKTGQGVVTAGTGAQLVIAAYPDGALIDGMYVENPSSETVTLTTNTASTNPRIDRLVMRLDMTAKTIAPFQIVGTPAASPSAPALTNTATVVDMPLCQYRFPGNGSAQNPGSIVDERVISPAGPLYGAELLRTAGVGLSNNALESQGFVSGDVVKDVGGFYTGSGTTTLTVPAGLGGLYLLSVSSGIAGGPVAARFFLSVYINGAEAFRVNGYGDDSANGAKTLRLAAGATIGVKALQAGGSTRSLSGLALNVHLIGT